VRTLFDNRESLSDRIFAFCGEHRLATAAAVALLVLGFVVYSGYERFAYMQVPDLNFDTRVAHPAFAGAHPKVLFDAAHFNFHTAGGNYRPFADLLRHDGYEITNNKDRFTPASLSRCRVLVIANALGAKGVLAMLANLAGWHSALQWDFAAFAPDECETVRDWVSRGGSLLLISDHAPTGRAAQALALQFGVDMSNWYTEDDQHSDPDAYSWLVYSRDNGLLVPHPVTEGRNADERVKLVMSFTGQSLKGPAGSTAFLRLADTARDYPSRTATLAEGRSAAGRATGVAMVFGRGRVVVLGEAAMLTAQVFRAAGRELRLGMEYPGCDNRQLALNIMHWLSGLLN